MRVVAILIYDYMHMNRVEARDALLCASLSRRVEHYFVRFPPKMYFVLAFIVCVALFSSAFATYGVDVSQATSSSSFSCMKSNGYSFAIVRVYQSSGHTDPNGPTTIANAWAGGMSHVDGYIFPCYSCGNPAGQVSFSYF